MNDDLDGDEAVLLIVSFVSGLATIVTWIVNLQVMKRLRTEVAIRRQLFLTPLFCVALLFLALRFWAAKEVRGSGTYLTLLLALGITWLGLTTRCFAWLGVSLRDDIVERANPSALAVWVGALFGATFAYAGGNIGEGPSLWNNVFSASLASVTLALLWLALELACRVSSSIVIERDVASGVRSAGFVVASGLILGRAVAGDWHSTAETVSDFVRDGWPVLILMFMAFIGECAWRPTSKSPSLPVKTHGVFPAVGYVALALLWLTYLGPFSPWGGK